MGWVKAYDVLGHELLWEHEVGEVVSYVGKSNDENVVAVGTAKGTLVLVSSTGDVLKRYPTAY